MDLSNVDNEEFELIIIGGGSAAFAAAIHADSIKISTLMIMVAYLLEVPV